MNQLPTRIAATARTALAQLRVDVARLRDDFAVVRQRVSSRTQRSRPATAGPPPAHRSRLAERVLIACGVLSLGYCAFTLVEAEVYDAVQTRRLERLRESELPVPAGMVPAATTDAAAGGTVPALAPRSAAWVAVATREEATAEGFVGRIEIDRLGVDAVIAEGITARALRRAVGHVPGTAFPGEVGNVGIAGHRDRHFRGLRDVVHGDRIVVETPDGLFEYEVAQIQIVEPDAVEVLAPTPEPTLTLVTCYPFWYLGHAPDRFIVSARLVGDPGGSSPTVAAR